MRKPMEMVDRKRQPPVKSLPSRAGREFKKFTHRSGIVVTVLFKGEKGFFLGTPSKGKTKARGPSSCPRARSMNPMVSKMPGASRGRGRGDRSAASEGGSVRGSPCGECARLRLNSLRPRSFGLLRFKNGAHRISAPRCENACDRRTRGAAGGSAEHWAGTLLSRIPEMNQECPR